MGGSGNPQPFTSAYQDLLRRRGIPNVGFHSLRHSHASQLLKLNLNPKIISERLGHAKVAFTLDTYSRLLPGIQEQAAATKDLALTAALSRRPPKHSSKAVA
jgi:integrase